ncbi:hypothetical protein DPMN_017720 [Dreissena polymorpha]|uniref:Uncharacterized protein n=1 Tax=Dreissena polymorpha TaxID=45954 RepID=A0A9D4NBX4_DREPO|nr:hypothetical protein DPMN_017720 [Dreissena polymorpha]
MLTCRPVSLSCNPWQNFATACSVAYTWGRSRNALVASVSTRSDHSSNDSPTP